MTSSAKAGATSGGATGHDKSGPRSTRADGDGGGLLTPPGGPGTRGPWSTERKMRPARPGLVVLFALVALAVVVGVAKTLGGTGRGGAAAAGTSTTTSAPATASPTGSSGTSERPGSSGSAAHTMEDEGGGTVVGPTSTTVPTSGAGTFTPLDAPGPQSTASGRVVRYSIEVENGVDIDRALFARTVHDVLLDARGWQSQDHVRFVDVTASQVAAGAPVDVRVTLATPSTVDRLCAPLTTRGTVSCANNGRAVLNLLRWETGAAAYGTDVARYRIYQINHEVGHVIGHGHRTCPKPGAPAPVMLQQTISLQGCTANTWPTVTQG